LVIKINLIWRKLPETGILCNLFYTRMPEVKVITAPEKKITGLYDLLFFLIFSINFNA